jgi:hypothetical protein
VRRLVPALLTVLTAACLVAGTAQAKEENITLSWPNGGPPTGADGGGGGGAHALAAGQLFSGLLTIEADPDMLAAMSELPSLTIRDEASGATQSFVSKRTGRANVFALSVRFPQAGSYSYTVRDGTTDRVYQFPTVTVTAGAGGSGLLPGWAFGAGGLLIAATAGLLAVRRHRPRPQPTPQVG